MSPVTIGCRRSEGAHIRTYTGYDQRSLHGYISGKSENMEMNSPGSESVGYGLNKESTPIRRKAA